MKNRVSLRSMFATLTVAGALFAVLVAAALVLLTGALHETTQSSASSVESILLAEEAEISLLLHERTRDPLVRLSIEADLFQKLGAAQAFATTEEEVGVLAQALQEARAYFRATAAPERAAVEVSLRLQGTYQALEKLVDINVAQARSAQQRAALWNALANVLGVLVGVVVIVSLMGVLVWLRARAFGPIMGLANAVERFGRGERDTRAAESGPVEIREMCARFNAMASAIAEQQHAQIAFLGGVAHDLRNPLQTLQLSVAMLMENRPLPSEEQLRQKFARMARVITRMDRMLGDFLDVARIEAGQLELRLDTHDARKIVTAVVELFRESSRDVTIHVRAPDQAVLVRCDPLRLEQVLTNLISNALKYSPKGSPVDVVLTARGDEAALSVSDRGRGIPEQDQESIFEPFRRTGSAKRAAPGVGLGLFVVRKIVEAHQGRVELDSAPGKGSTFRVVLPTAREREEPSLVPGRAPPASAH